MRDIASRASCILLALTMSAPQAFACGFDAVVGDTFSAQHPASISVALAISEGVRAGRIGAEAAAPIEAGPKGYWRAMSRLQRFQHLLGEAAGDRTDLPDMSVLLVDSQLWTRFRASQSGYRIEQHAAGPAPDDVVIITGEYVLDQIAAGAISPAEALETGVIAVDGRSEAAGIVRNNVLARINPARAAGAASTGATAPAWANAGQPKTAR